MSDTKYRVELVASKTLEVTLDHAELSDGENPYDVAQEMAIDAAFGPGILPPGVEEVMSWDMDVESVVEIKA